MTRRTVLTTLAMTVVLIACGEGEKEKSLAVRLYEHRLKRCQAMMPKDELDQCSPREGDTYRTGLGDLHRVMVNQVMKTFPQDGTCTMHGSVYLVCQERMMDGKTRNVLYRVDAAKDGSDSQVLYVWSQDW